MIIKDVRETLDIANEYFERHEEDNDRADQDAAMEAVLWAGGLIGVAVGLGIAGTIALAVKILK